MTGHYCKVTAYAGYKANERPLSFTIDDQRLDKPDNFSEKFIMTPAEEMRVNLPRS